MKRSLLTIALLLLFSSPLFSAIAHVQTASATAAAGTTISVTLTLTAGNAVVGIFLHHNSANPPVGLSQTAGDTLTLATSSFTSGEYTRFGVNHSVAGGSTTFTYTWTNTLISALYIMEISGMTSSSSFDVQANNASTTATTHSSGTTGTLAQPNQIAIAAFNGNGSGPTTFTSVSNGYTVPTNGNRLGGASNFQSLVCYLITSSTSGQETTLTTSNMTGHGQIATFKEHAGRYLIETSSVDGYLLENGSGVLELEKAPGVTVAARNRLLLGVGP